MSITQSFVSTPLTTVHPPILFVISLKHVYPQLKSCSLVLANAEELPLKIKFDSHEEGDLEKHLKSVLCIEGDILTAAIGRFLSNYVPLNFSPLAFGN